MSHALGMDESRERETAHNRLARPATIRHRVYRAGAVGRVGMAPRQIGRDATLVDEDQILGAQRRREGTPRRAGRGDIVASRMTGGAPGLCFGVVSPVVRAWRSQSRTIRSPTWKRSANAR